MRLSMPPLVPMGLLSRRESRLLHRGVGHKDPGLLPGGLTNGVTPVAWKQTRLSNFGEVSSHFCSHLCEIPDHGLIELHEIDLHLRRVTCAIEHFCDVDWMAEFVDWYRVDRGGRVVRYLLVVIFDGLHVPNVNE